MCKCKMLKSFLAVLVALFMLLSFSSCSRSSKGDSTSDETSKQETKPIKTEGTEEQKETSKEPITVKIWMNNASVTGIQTNPCAKEIAKQTGVTMEIISGDAQKFKVMFAGNDLPDIVQQNYTSLQVDANTLITSGQLLPLDSLVEDYGVNLKKNVPKVLEYTKRFLSNDENKIYFLPTHYQKADPENPMINNSVVMGTHLRWDIYEKVGCPEINGYDDLINVLKMMQDANPKTHDGKKVYAISGWSDWGYWPWYMSNVYSLGNVDNPNGMLLDCINGEAVPKLRYNEFWKSVDFYNKAYRMGLFDTEAFTMKYDQFLEKCKTGQVLMLYASFMSGWINQTIEAAGRPGEGYQYVITGHPYAFGIIAGDQPVGWGADYPFCISKNCKNPERALQLLDFFYSYDGARLLWSGIQGKHWDFVDGKPVPTEEYLNGVKSDPEYNNKEGVGMYSIFNGMDQLHVAPDGFPVSISNSEHMKGTNLLQVDKDYLKYWGEKNGKEYRYLGQAQYDFIKQGKIDTWTKSWVFDKLVGQPDDDTKKIMSQVDEYMKVQIAKIIMAETEEKCKAQIQKAKDDIKAKGYDEAVEEILGLYEKAKQDMGTFDPYN